MLGGLSAFGGGEGAVQWAAGVDGVRLVTRWTLSRLPSAPQTPLRRWVGPDHHAPPPPPPSASPPTHVHRPPSPAPPQATGKPITLSTTASYLTGRMKTLVTKLDKGCTHPLAPLPAADGDPDDPARSFAYFDVPGWDSDDDTTLEPPGDGAASPGRRSSRESTRGYSATDAPPAHALPAHKQRALRRHSTLIAIQQPPWTPGSGGGSVRSRSSRPTSQTSSRATSRFSQHTPPRDAARLSPGEGGRRGSRRVSFSEVEDTLESPGMEPAPPPDKACGVLRD